MEAADPTRFGPMILLFMTDEVGAVLLKPPSARFLPYIKAGVVLKIALSVMTIGKVHTGCRGR